MANEIVKVEGLRECKDALRQLPDATARNVLRRVGFKALDPVIMHAWNLVPVRKGELRDSLAVSTKLTQRQRRKNTKTGDDVEIYAGAGPHPQAHMQEFGTVKERAQPFLRPAWDAKRRDVLDGIKKDLWDEIKKAADRVARKMARSSK